MFTLHGYIAKLIVTVVILLLVALALPAMIENLSEKLNAAVTPEKIVRTR